MTCDHVRERLTAYLDGDLDADGGTVVRGHLRTCEACRRVASAEAALRDGLRALPTVDPPSTLWAGVQARLAAVEVAEASRPAWRRTLARWAPVMPRFAAGGALAAAAVTVLWWRSAREPAAEPVIGPVTGPAIANPSPVIRSDNRQLAAAQDPAPPSPAPAVESTGCQPGTTGDVTAELAADPARLATCYAQAVDELLALAGELRGHWSDSQRAAFDARVQELRESIAIAEDGKPRQRAWRAMVRYLQRAIVRDEVSLASGGVR